MDDYTYQMAEKDSIPQQVALFNKAFGSSETESMWHQKHYMNPLSKASNVFCAIEGERIIGLSTYVPLQYIYQNTIYSAIQPCDVCVDPAYQGRGIFTGILKYAEAYYADQGWDVMITFPNNKSYGAFIKLGWTVTCRIKKLYLPIDAKTVLQERFSRRVPSLANAAMEILWLKIRWKAAGLKNIRVQKRDRMPEGWMEGVRNPDALSFYATPEMQDWKLADGYVFYEAREGEMPIASFLVKDYRRSDRFVTANLAAVHCDTEDEEKLTAAYAKLMLDLKRDHTLLCIWDTCYEKGGRIPRELGFLKSNVSKEGSPFLTKVLTEDPERRAVLSNSSLWRPQMIETDTFSDFRAYESNQRS